jgi:thiol-disulfide isomerase/thioredoxin
MLKVLLAVACAAALSGQSPLPDAKTLLTESGQALDRYKSYQVDQDIVIDIKGEGMENHVLMSVTVAAQKPGKLRVESKGQMGGTLMVSDGANTWMYLGPLKQYVHKAAAMTPEALVKNIVPGASQIMDQLKSQDPTKTAKVSGEESIEIAGAKRDCFVIEMTFDQVTIPAGMKISSGKQRIWIEKSTKQAVKQTMDATMEGGPLPKPMQFSQSMTVTSEKLDVPLPDSLFSFTPPMDAKEVAEIGALEKTTLTGKPAPEIGLKALDGKEYRLENLRGKVVLVDFWATWCIPCRMEMPVLEKLHQDYASKGLVILGVNAGEDRGVIESYLEKEKVSFPVLLAAPGSAVLKSYDANAFPSMVFIDRAGKVTDYQVGRSSEEKLREKLGALGLSTAVEKKP